MTHTIITEDGVPVQAGDTVFNYYDLKWGVISTDVDDQGWFTLLHADNTRAILNGQRIATKDYLNGTKP